VIPPQVSHTGVLTYLYTTTQFPVSMTNDADIAVHAAHVASPPQIVVPGGNGGYVR
jgi:hypothetical protein